MLKLHSIVVTLAVCLMLGLWCGIVKIECYNKLMYRTAIEIVTEYLKRNEVG